MEKKEQTTKSTRSHKIKLGTFEVEFLPLDTPLREHLQAISVALNLSLTLCGTTIAPLLLAYVFFYTRFWFLVPLYIAWIYYDREAGFTGGRKWNWYRRNVIFKYFSDYFPSKLIKTADLPADTNYLFVVYPHGVLSFSTLACFGSEANNVEGEKYPGIEFHIVTLDINFHSPITREYFLFMGAIAAKEKSIKHVLNSKPSQAVVLVAGGASEAQIASPGDTYEIIVSRRKGFVRIALQTGVPLVPVFSFGEHNLYTQYRSKWLTIVQQTIKKFTGIYPVVPKGRGIFQYSFGVLPRKDPINTIVGKPIPVPKIENPTKEDIDEYHAKFVQELKALFEEYKHKYDAAGSDAKLITV